MESNEKLLKRIEQLEKVLNLFKERETNRLKQNYDAIRGKIDNALFKSERIETLFDTTQDKLKLAKLLNLIIAANNPTNDKLGFKLFDIIYNTAEDVLTKNFGQLEGEEGKKTKGRFLSIISKVINNPIADVILKSNPVSGIISNVMNAASNFINTTVIGKKFKQAKTITTDLIAQEKLTAFKKALEKYAVFYSSLLEVTNKFQKQLDIISSKNADLSISLKDYHNRFLVTLGIDESAGEIISQFNKVFELQEIEGELNYNDLLNKEEIIKAAEIAERMPAFDLQVNSFVNEFTNALASFITSYIAVLETALNWDEKDIDKEKLQKLIKKLKNYKKRNVQEKVQLNPASNKVERIVMLTPKILSKLA